MLPVGVYAVDRLMGEARRLAAEYRRATGKTLPISNEIAVSDAIRLLELVPYEGEEGGVDAIGTGGWEGERIQVKARAFFDESRGKPRIGQLAMDKPWDRILLVLMDEDYETFEIISATRAAIEESLSEKSPSPGQRKRGAMSVARFRIIGEPVWTREEGRIAAPLWTNQSGE